MRAGATILLAACSLAVCCAADEAPISPTQAVARMTLPPGFHVSLVGGEPAVIKPIAMTTDDRGRLWVVESHSYPHWQTKPGTGHDRVLVFDQRDGVFAAPKIVLDDGVNLSGIAWGFGGIWLTAPPNLLFIPIHAATDKPAGPATVVLDGWDLTAKHNVVNGLMWGPDGWLYGLNGILSKSHVGAPGTPADRRVSLDCGVWRYHPTRKIFESVASGTTNPWGLDFDDEGEIFITNCVIKHLFHVVPGGRYVRMFGQDVNPHSFGLMPSCADHIHWGGGDWTTSRGGAGAHDAPGGGHAHAGALIYLGDTFPASYRNHVFMCNIHGNRLNQDVLEKSGSGYVAHHAPDFLLAHDPWFRGLGLQASSNGIFVSDWHDTGECHNYDKVHPSGRLYHVTYGDSRQAPFDVSTLSDEELVRLQVHKNDWWVRHARRALQERAAGGKLSPSVVPALQKLFSETPDSPRKLRPMWALHALGALDEKALLALLEQRQDSIRVWAVRFLVETTPTDAVLSRLVMLARTEPAAAVRLALASALQRLPMEQRWELAGALAAHAEDADDANIPCMAWYGIEPLASRSPERAADLLTRTRLPLVRQNLARRLAEQAD